METVSSIRERFAIRANTKEVLAVPRTVRPKIPVKNVFRGRNALLSSRVGTAALNRVKPAIRRIRATAVPPLVKRKLAGDVSPGLAPNSRFAEMESCKRTSERGATRVNTKAAQVVRQIVRRRIRRAHARPALPAFARLPCVAMALSRAPRGAIREKALTRAAHRPVKSSQATNAHLQERPACPCVVTAFW